MSQTTWVAIGCSSWRDYNCLAPLSALLWRHRIGFEPIVLMTGDWAEKARSKTALRALDECGIRRVQVGKTRYEEANVAQNCRQFAAALALPEDDWLMPSDADLWPVRSDFYYQHQDGPAATSYYSNGDHGQTLPTCHVAMRVKTWRELYGVRQGDYIGAKVEALLDGWLPTYAERWPWKERNFALWMSDQAILTERVRTLPKEQVRMIERRGHPPVDRIDRGAWPKEIGDISRWTDAHLLRAPDQQENWPRVFELFKALLPEWAEWAQAYRDEFVKGY